MSKRVLLTGANGYIGQHILHVFLAAGHSVRAVVRSQAKIDQLAASFRPYASSSRLDFAVVPDITAAGAFDDALASSPPFDAVVHTASPFNYRTSTKNADYLEPAVKGTTEIIEGVKRRAPGVKRVVITSSMAAIVDFAAPKVTSPAKVYAEADWNPTTWETALETTVVNTVYQASKKYAELAAWDIAAGKAADGSTGSRPGFDLVTLCPPMVYGPVFDPDAVAEPKALNQSTWVIYANLMKPDGKSTDAVPPAGLHLYVDVRDIAQAHLLAVEKAEAGGKRFVVCAGGISNQRIANLLRAALPELRDRIPEGEPGKDGFEEGMFAADASLVQKVLGLRFRPDAETIGDLAVQLRDIDKRRAS